MHAQALMFKMAQTPTRSTWPPWQPRNLVKRKCRLCEWEGEQVELSGADPDCPWCHGPTEVLQAVPLPGGIIVSGMPHAKNTFAAALGRLGAKKEGWPGLARSAANADATSRARQLERAGGKLVRSRGRSHDSLKQCLVS